ncbi:Uncharacterized protein Avbf_15388 [Armadillidium vulgare]|nr:Uncharacterized protein Avbf_15388 [Armadillidium vulgare]
METLPKFVNQFELKVLLDLARIIFEEQSTIEQMVYRIMTHTQSLLQCERVQVLLVHEASQGSFSRVFDLEVKDLQEEDADSRTNGEYPDAYEDPRFDKSVDAGSSFKPNLFCVCRLKILPRKSSGGSTIISLMISVSPLTMRTSWKLFLSFAEWESTTRTLAMAKQKVTLEVLSYHAAAPKEDADKLKVRLQVKVSLL